MRYLVFLLTVLFSFPVLAKDEITLYYPIEQGSLVFGHTTRRNVPLIANGVRVPVSSGGNFVIGLDMNATELDLNGKKVSIGLKQYRRQEINGLPENMVTPSASEKLRIERESDQIKRALAQDVFRSNPGCFARPAQGAVTGLFGSQRILNGQPKSPHMGVDIAAKEGDPVFAANSGTVVLVGDFYYTGNTIIIDHGLGTKTIYAHLSAVEVREGQRVGQNRRIGRVGSTGRSTGPHLHYGLVWNGVRVDPMSPYTSSFCATYTDMPAATATLRLSID